MIKWSELVSVSRKEFSKIYPDVAYDICDKCKNSYHCDLDYVEYSDDFTSCCKTCKNKE